MVIRCLAYLLVLVGVYMEVFIIWSNEDSNKIYTERFFP